MQTDPRARSVVQARKRGKRWIPAIVLACLTAAYLLMLIPGPEHPPPPAPPGNKPFAWDRDALWSGLEERFRQAREADPETLKEPIENALADTWALVDDLASGEPGPADARWGRLETNVFILAPMAAVVPEALPEYVQVCNRIRAVVKAASRRWDMQSESRQRLYRLLYGTRAALEEALLQVPPEMAPSIVPGINEPSQTPSTNILGIAIHSGDILVSRGGAATSALIARGNDYPGNFSHIAFVHVDEGTGKPSIIEAHIESGVSVTSVERYLKDTKLRVMVLRLRSDLPQLLADPLLPQKAASAALSEAERDHIPYDFAMDYHDPAKQFCSEVASAPYRQMGVELWSGISRLSAPGLRSWLAALGVRHFETQQPSDLEYDPQLVVVAEWRNPGTLFKDHVDNAATDVLLEAANNGKAMEYPRFMLPVARVAKGWSVLLNSIGLVGPIPEGMSATAALRSEWYSEEHARIVQRVLAAAARFKEERGYNPPYWALVKMALAE